MSSEVQEDLEGLQNALLNTDSVEQFLRELAVLSAQAMGGMMSCGMSLRQQGRPSSVTACSDPLASSADEVQHQTGDGPSLHAMRHARPRPSTSPRTGRSRCCGASRRTPTCGCAIWPPAS